MEHKVLLQESCEKMGVTLTEEIASQFMTYLSLLLEWNEKMNLTAITDKKDVVQKHFVDCLSILPHLSLTGQEKIIDVGTGAGFPGIPVKIACPDVEMTLLDSLQKRIGFLEEVGSQLGLSGVHYVLSIAGRKMAVRTLIIGNSSTCACPEPWQIWQSLRNFACLS